jgi:hypothetical protein
MLLVQRTGLQGRKRRCTSTARHLILGIRLSWACTRARPRASCTGRGASETGPHVCTVPTAIAPLKDIENLCNTFFFPPGLVPARVLPGSCAVPARFSSAAPPLRARAFGIQLAVAKVLATQPCTGQHRARMPVKCAQATQTKVVRFRTFKIPAPAASFACCMPVSVEFRWLCVRPRGRGLTPSCAGGAGGERIERETKPIRRRVYFCVCELAAAPSRASR